ncbi:MULTISPECIES: MFS transporter [unclassified Paludibacterium]|uniref:MFS transporter n=1 Tax=unclassified Paludibacterium TaxID=2618429 RepID=UPI001C04E73B|nr:MFS transporter [Paludibacterium sp. B53371]BEV72589.1 MFS transporter [Paludibacterium sp. THUN1379]
MTEQDHAGGGLFRADRMATSIGAVSLIMLLAFEAIAVAAVMPTVARALHGMDHYAVAFGGTLAASVVGMVLGGEVCDRRTPWLACWLGALLFTAGLLLAGLAGNMSLLVWGRVLQGLGAGLLSVALYVGCCRVMPASLHPQLFALFAAGWVVPALVGPVVAAGLVAWLGWRAVFLLVALLTPLALGLLWPAMSRLPRLTSGAPLRWEQPAWSLLAALGAMSLHQAVQCRSGLATALMVAAGLAAVLLAARRLLPHGSLRAAPGLPSVVAMRGLIAAAFFNAEAYIPLQLSRDGWSVAQAGAALTAGALMWSAGSALQARLPSAWRRRGLTAGFVLFVSGTLLALLAMRLGTPWVLVLGWAVVGLGIGLSFPMLSVLTMQLSRPEEQGSNASALQLSDALFSSVVLALGALLLQPAAGQMPSAMPALWTSALLALLAVWISPRSQQESEADSRHYMI